MTLIQKMNANDSIDSSTYDNNKYYFAFRQNKSEWGCNLKRPFLLNIDGTRITGQFISTMWFNQEIQPTDTLDFMILRLPITSNITNNMVFQTLSNAENTNTPLCSLDMVLLHKQYTPNNLQNILEDAYLKMKYDLHKHQEKVIITNKLNFGISFNIVKEKTVKIYEKKGERNECVCVCVCCPSFEFQE